MGGVGNDTYIVGSGDVVIEMTGEGDDTVMSDVSYTLGDHIENLILTGGGNINGTGNAIDNTLIGNSGVNTLTGGAGNDTYIVGEDDVVVELSGEGDDTVMSDASYTLGDHIENLILTGGGNIDGTGNALDNTLIGNSGNNTLAGAAGVDVMLGGLGDDLYIVDNAGDVVSEEEDEGIDTVEASVSYTLGDHIENLVLTGSGNINATGNALDNVLTGNSGTNTLTGGLGNDTYIVGSGDVVVEAEDEGEDTVMSDASYTLGDHIESLVLTGTGNIDGTGNALDNTLIGNSGTNTLTGGLGNDTYIVGSGDVVVEREDEGEDTVMSDASYTLGDHIENLVLTGAGNINGTGNSGNNTITGNGGNNTLAGMGGLDTLIGGFGNDTYVVSAVTDVIIEEEGEGQDTVMSAFSWLLEDHVEALVLTGSGNINGMGNDLDNTLIGNSGVNTLTGGIGNDTLNGLSGADTLIGGVGNDVYIVSDAAVTLIEEEDEGIDTVVSSVNWTLGGDFENLTLTGVAKINGIGNAGDNILIGNSASNTLTGGAGNDTLDGGAGADRLIGGEGDDTYIVDRGSDTVIEQSGQGNDTVISYVSYELGNHVENLVLAGASSSNGYGNSLDNLLIGNSSASVLAGGAGNDTLVGGGGNDTLKGDAGDDTYVYSSGIVRINDRAGGGDDTLHFAGDITINDISIVRSGSSAKVSINKGPDEILLVYQHKSSGSYTIENVTFDDGFEASLSDYQSWISGTSANNTITGTSGADTIIGKDGNDTLNGGNGVDNIHGGSGNDMIRGGDGSDLLHGGLGDDILYGDDGADILFGGAGADAFRFEAATAYGGVDTIRDFSAAEGDVIDISDVLDGIYDPMSDALTDFVQFSQSGSDTVVSIDRDGAGSTYGWTQIALLQGVVHTDEAALVAANNLLVA